ncbi:hypothetical protein Cgig2_004253 [Carnegiea gigantea]|uniref:Uncharacterized protein n=1 Tax=Carnegiea gigantea TaxID=171969 RepID=A0A9Q1KGQ3_9CARY|nr:hypothetical protein Cgig2_004253 [Carnegiea gigantea]
MLLSNLSYALLPIRQFCSLNSNPLSPSISRNHRLDDGDDEGVNDTLTASYSKALGEGPRSGCSHPIPLTGSFGFAIFEGKPLEMLLLEILRIFKDSKFEISQGRRLVRSVADTIKVLIFLNYPISGGIDLNRGTNEMAPWWWSTKLHPGPSPPRPFADRYAPKNHLCDVELSPLKGVFSLRSTPTSRELTPSLSRLAEAESDDAAYAPNAPLRRRRVGARVSKDGVFRGSFSVVV